MHDLLSETVGACHKISKLKHGHGKLVFFSLSLSKKKKKAIKINYLNETIMVFGITS